MKKTRKRKKVRYFGGKSHDLLLLDLSVYLTRLGGPFFFFNFVVVEKDIKIQQPICPCNHPTLNLLIHNVPKWSDTLKNLAANASRFLKCV